ncbi:MAG: DUF6165 family protein [Pseudomonadota bacterium]
MTKSTIPAPIMVEIGPGELLDKLSILHIKADRISDPAKLANIRYELGVLEKCRKANVPDSETITALFADLRKVNEALWEIEDDIRDCEAAGDFGDKFIQLARSVYLTNDKRAALKKEINLALNAAIVEEKSYSDYQGTS